MSKEEKIKYMTDREFVEKGYLSELNRRFFHPLGLAMEYETDGKGLYRMSGIRDYRDNPGGVSFGIRQWELSTNPIDEEQFIAFLQRKMFINSELVKRQKHREKNLGGIIEDALPLDPEHEKMANKLTVK